MGRKKTPLMYNQIIHILHERLTSTCEFDILMTGFHFLVWEDWKLYAIGKKLKCWSNYDSNIIKFYAILFGVPDKLKMDHQKQQ